MFSGSSQNTNLPSLRRKKLKERFYCNAIYRLPSTESYFYFKDYKDEKSLSDKDQPFGNTKYLGIRYVMPGFLSSNLIPVQSRCVTV